MLFRSNEIKNGMYILSDDGFNEVMEVYPKTKQKVYKIITESGKTIKCSDKHLFPTENGVLSISTGLKIGDNLYVK